MGAGQKHLIVLAFLYINSIKNPMDLRMSARDVFTCCSRETAPGHLDCSERLSLLQINQSKGDEKVSLTTFPYIKGDCGITFIFMVSEVWIFHTYGTLYFLVDCLIPNRGVRLLVSSFRVPCSAELSLNDLRPRVLIACHLIRRPSAANLFTSELVFR